MRDIGFLKLFPSAWLTALLCCLVVAFAGSNWQLEPEALLSDPCGREESKHEGESEKAGAELQTYHRVSRPGARRSVARPGVRSPAREILARPRIAPRLPLAQPPHLAHPPLIC
ncbi:MAG: hypothetical protein HY816_19150 [Candidatus Wallbacteria bacterium]|nr:hypothetical protein [Candidatus Wallbacteria bacterium]